MFSRIQLNREVSTSSINQDDNHDEIFLGDEHKVNLQENKEKVCLSIHVSVSVNIIKSNTFVPSTGVPCQRTKAV